jgi:small neutral amino acid transporter SnatA (MarC family)
MSGGGTVRAGQSSNRKREVMGKFWLVIFAILFIGIGAGVIFLMTWDIPAPQERTEKVLPDDMFPR